MPTTDIEGAAFGNPTKAEADYMARVNAANVDAAARENVASLRLAESRDAAARSSGAIRGEGTLTQYRPVGGWQDSGPGGSGSTPTLRAVARDAELGAPTSFSVGAGAPEPIGASKGNTPRPCGRPRPSTGPPGWENMSRWEGRN